MSNKGRTINIINETNIPLAALDDLCWTIYLLAKDVGIENIRFRSNPIMKCSAREVESIKKISSMDTKNIKYEILLNKGGLDHVTGLLPPWLTEILAGNFIEYHNNNLENVKALDDFLNIFSHYIVRQIYLVFIKNQPALEYQAGGKDQISKILFSFLGISENNELLNTSRLLSYVGVLGNHQSRSAQGLQGILSDFFYDTIIEVKEFIPRKVKISKDDIIYFGKQDVKLGGDHILGKWIKDVSGFFRIVIGPMNYSLFKKFLPKENRFKSLVKFVKIYAPPQLSWDLILKVKCESLPNMCFGSGSLAQDVWFMPKKTKFQNSKFEQYTCLSKNKTVYDVVIDPKLLET